MEALEIVAEVRRQIKLTTPFTKRWFWPFLLIPISYFPFPYCETWKQKMFFWVPFAFFNMEGYELWVGIKPSHFTQFGIMWLGKATILEWSHQHMCCFSFPFSFLSFFSSRFPFAFFFYSLIYLRVCLVL